MSLPKYKYLLTYRIAEIIHDLTVEFCKRHLGYVGHQGDLIERPKLPEKAIVAANLMLTLCHLETYLLSKQIAKAESDFVEKGGYTEKLFKKRLSRRIG